MGQSRVSILGAKKFLGSNDFVSLQDQKNTLGSTNCWNYPYYMKERKHSVRHFHPKLVWGKRNIRAFPGNMERSKMYQASAQPFTLPQE